MTEKEIVETIRSSGARGVGVCAVSDIVFDKSLRGCCEANYCGAYGKNYACPPLSGTADEMIERVKKFDRAIVFQTVSALSDSFDFEGMTKAAKNHTTLHLELLKKTGVSFSLAVGGCGICESCAAVSGEPCRFPSRVIHSLEASCINVSELARTVGLNYINEENTVTYFSAFFL